MESRTGRLGLPRAVARGVALGVLACLAALAGATPVRAAGEDAEQPGIARVSLIEGEASYLRGDGDDWTGVSVNAPLVTGDRFYSGADSRAEIQLAPAVYARLSSETELGMLELGPDTTQVRLSVGLVTVRVRRSPGDRHVEIDTPGAAIVVREPGIYRVHVMREGDTNLQVRDGEATVYVADERYEIGDGRGVMVDGVGDAARPRIYAVSGGDGWDQWEADRARRADGAASYQYVSDDVYGVEDLDEYGDWEHRPEYGNVWRPRHVDEGWAPYTSGRWVWVDPWGWTWLGYEPWGWAPYHYGRWVYLDSYWAWAPGPIVASPVYAPALVGWFGAGFGWGGGVSVSVGFGSSVGWVPLGWGEPCFPWWGGWGGVVVGSPWWGGWGGPRIYNNVVINKNITNINISNYNFGNLRKPGGFSTVPVRDFLGGRSGRHLPPGAGRSDFRAIGGRVPVVPTRESLPATSPSRVGVGRTVQPSRDVLGRQVVSARTPAGGQPSFARKLPMLERSSGTPLTPATLRELGSEGGRSPLVRTVAPGGAGATGRTQPRTDGGRGLPGVQTSGGGTDEGRRTASFGSPRGAAPSAGRSPVGATSGDRGSDRSVRSVPRPPAVQRDSYPTAPRAGGSRERYVARRPAWDDGGGSAAPRDRSAPRSTWTSGDRAPRNPAGGGRGAPSTGTAPQQRSSGRTWFSQPRTVVPSERGETRSAPRSYASTGSRATPPISRSAPPPRGGGAPQVRTAPGPSGSTAPRTSAAPRTYTAPPTSGAPRTYSAPRGGGAPAAPSFSGRSMPSGGGFSGRSAGVTRSFGGSGGAPSFGGRGGGFGSSGGGGGGGGGGMAGGGGR